MVKVSHLYLQNVMSDYHTAHHNPSAHCPKKSPFHFLKFLKSDFSNFVHFRKYLKKFQVLKWVCHICFKCILQIFWSVIIPLVNSFHFETSILVFECINLLIDMFNVSIWTGILTGWITSLILKIILNFHFVFVIYKPVIQIESLIQMKSK